MMFYHARLRQTDQYAAHKGQGEEAQKPLQVVMEHHMGTFQVEPFGLQMPKQAFDLPPLLVQRQQRSCWRVPHDHHAITLRSNQDGDIQGTP